MKKIFYTIATIFLTFQISFLLHGLFEMWYIKNALSKGRVLEDTHFLGGLYCVLPLWLSYGLLLTALIGGYFLAQTWWRIVYIEKRHWRLKNKNKK